MIRLAILASGSGSNAQKIINHFKQSKEIEVHLVGSNKKDAYVLERAQKVNVKHFTFNKNKLNNGEVLHKLKEEKVDYIILAGFLALIPKELVKAFPMRIINIHPSLLPKFGGKGMYGMHVHEAVKKAGEVYSGLTVHLVNEEFDKGKVLFQATVKIQENESAEDIASKVLNLEHRYFSQVIESYISSHNIN